MKTNQRHHAVHPPTEVKPNVAVNRKPEAYTKPEQAAMPNVNPSLPGPVGVDAINMRVTDATSEIDLPDNDGCDPDDEDCVDDRQQIRPTETFIGG